MSINKTMDEAILTNVNSKKRNIPINGSMIKV